MNRRPNLAARLAFGLTGLWVLARPGTAHAEPPDPAAPAYQDRYIAGGSLAPDISTGDGSTGDAASLFRSLEVDGIASVQSSGSSGASSSTQENGLIVRSQWETMTYGAFSLDGSVRTGASGQAESGQGGVITLRQRGMPFDDGWHVDNALGDVNSLDIGL